MENSTSTRSKDIIWLIGHPSGTITGARLPSGLDVMQNFVYYHRKQKLTVADSAQHVYDQLMPFWLKSRLPVRHKPNIVLKIKDLYSQHVGLVKHRSRNNAKDQQNQKDYRDKLDSLFDISHANSDELIKNNEDREFLKLQRKSRTGCIGSADNKTFHREERASERKERLLQRTAASFEPQTIRGAEEDDESEPEDLQANISTSDSDQNSTKIDNVVVKSPRKDLRNRVSIITQKVAAVLDRTNTSIRTSTMIMASLVNEIGSSTSEVVLSKSTVHRQRQQFRREEAEQIKDDFRAKKCIVHWDGKMLPDITGTDTKQVDRLPVLVSSVIDGSIKLLGVPKLASGSGQAAANAVLELLKSWQCDTVVIGMCFDTTASNTGRTNGACTLLEAAIGRNLLWMACRHHMFEVLLSDAFGVCFGPSTGPEILIFKRFRVSWSELMHYQPKPRPTPLIYASAELKEFIFEQLQLNHPRDDYKEFLQLAASIVGLNCSATIRKPGALHRARWMAKAIYAMKIELLFDGNESVLQLTTREFRGIQRFNRFVVTVYIQSWFSCRMVADAPINDIMLIQRLDAYDDAALSTTGLKMMERHSWYVSQELATLSLFSRRLSSNEKAHLVSNMFADRGLHLTKSLPRSTADLSISRSFFKTTAIDASFLDIPVDAWDKNQSYKMACQVVNNLACVNDCAERGVALIQNFNATITKDEEQKQFLLQVVEKHRLNFSKCNRDNLADM